MTKQSLICSRKKSSEDVLVGLLLRTEEHALPRVEEGLKRVASELHAIEVPEVVDEAQLIVDPVVVKHQPENLAATKKDPFLGDGLLDLIDLSAELTRHLLGQSPRLFAVQALVLSDVSQGFIGSSRPCNLDNPVEGGRPAARCREDLVTD